MLDNLETLISIAVLGLVFWAARNQGKANPVDTSTLQKTVNAVKVDIAGVKSDVAGVKRDISAVKSNLAVVRQEVDNCPTGEDIAALKELLTTELANVRREIAAGNAQSERTDQAVVRIEMLLMARALPPPGSGSLSS